MNEYYALYDINDECIGTFDKKQLKKFINTNNNSFNCILSRLRGGFHKYIYVRGTRYQVYIYEEYYGRKNN